MPRLDVSIPIQNRETCSICQDQEVSIQESKEERWNTWRGKSDDTRAKGEKKKKRCIVTLIHSSHDLLVNLFRHILVCDQREYSTNKDEK